jgi:hypothetical protein
MEFNVGCAYNESILVMIPKLQVKTIDGRNILE